MKEINFKKDIQPHLISISVFLIITILYFKPVFFDNKGLPQKDIQHWQGGAKELLDYREQTGEEGLWTDSMFGGMPAYLISVKWGNEAITAIQAIISFGLPHPVRIIFLSFLSFYILLLVYRVRPMLAMAGAIAFGLSSFNIIGLMAGHNARIAAIAFMPLVLAGIHLAFSKSRLQGFALAALGLALQLRVNHLQITYYLLLIVIAYSINVVVIAIKEKRMPDMLKTSGVLIGAALLALCTFIGEFKATYDYGKNTMRGKSELTTEISSDANKDGLSKAYAFRYNMGIFESMTLMIPNIIGGSSAQKLSKDSNLGKALIRNGMGGAQLDQQLQAVPTYWGEQGYSSPYYAGAIVSFLFILGIIVCDRKVKVWILAMFTLGLMLSWGSNFSSFNYFMFDYFPGYNKFRSVTFAFIITIFSMNLLGFLGLEKLLSDGWNKESKKQLLTAISIAGGICLLFILGAGVFSFRGAVDARLGQLPEWFLTAVIDDRQSLMRSDSFRSFLFIALSFGGIWLTMTNKLKLTHMLMGLSVLVIIDMWVVDKRYLHEEIFKKNPARAFFSISDADKEILKDKSPSYRVLNLANPWNEARTSYYHKSIGGYHGAKLRRYQDVIDKYLANEHAGMIDGLRSGQVNFEEFGRLNMLNTKYLMAGGAKEAVINNPSANGSAWVASKVISVQSPDEEIVKLAEINTKTEAIVDVSKFTLEGNSTQGKGRIEIKEYKTNLLRYEANMSTAGLGVFSEIYYPDGWKATIDGKPVVIKRANYILRALEIPAGKHEIVFSFEPKIFNIGSIIMRISSYILILVCLFAGWRAVKN